MRSSLKWLHCSLAMGCVVGIAQGQTPQLGAPQAPVVQQAAAPSITLSAESVLQARVTIDAVNRPLEDLFTELSAQNKAVLTVSRDLRDQRVNLSVFDIPLYQVMERLTGLLSHSPDAPREYFWEKVVTPGETRPTYVLRRDAQARRAEQTQGTVTQLVNRICQEWEYHPFKSGDTYYLWRRSWAWDRASDISDRWLKPWRDRLEKRGALTTDDHAAMASGLTLLQTALTLPVVLPNAGMPQLKDGWQSLRVWQRLAPGDRDKLRQGTLAFDALPGSQQTAITRAISDGTPFSVSGATLVMQSVNRDKPGTFPATLTVKSGDGATLWQGFIRD